MWLSNILFLLRPVRKLDHKFRCSDLISDGLCTLGIQTLANRNFCEVENSRNSQCFLRINLLEILKYIYFKKKAKTRENYLSFFSRIFLRLRLILKLDNLKTITQNVITAVSFLVPSQLTTLFQRLSNVDAMDARWTLFWRFVPTVICSSWISFQVHFVHYNRKYADIGAAADKADGLLVLGYFFEVSRLGISCL